MKRALLLLLLSGCTAVNVERRGVSRYAPADERPGGRVSYLANGAGFIVSARRENAYEEMYGFCGGNQYRITNEYDVAGGSVSTANVTGHQYGAFATGSAVAMVVHVVDFDCGDTAPRPQMQPAPSAEPADENAGYVEPTRYQGGYEARTSRAQSPR